MDIEITYICTGCGKTWYETRFDRDYTSGGIFYDGAFYGDDGVKRTCPTCSAVLREVKRVFPWEVK